MQGRDVGSADAKPDKAICPTHPPEIVRAILGTALLRSPIVSPCAEFETGKHTMILFVSMRCGTLRRDSEEYTVDVRHVPTGEIQI